MADVTSMADFKKKKKCSKTTKEQKDNLMEALDEMKEHDAVADEVFADAMKKHEENRKRMNAERIKANKGVLRSYRIKT